MSLTDLMIRHHTALDMMLNLFREELNKGTPDSENLFEDFKWELEKHVFAEERVMFKLCTEPSACKLAEQLSGVHKITLDFLETMNKKDDSDISKLQNLLTGHRHIEEKELYPRLDETLNDKQKELTFGRINEISPRLG